MHIVITAASFGVNFFKEMISEDALLKPVLETASNYAAPALIATAALHGAYSYLKPPSSELLTPPRKKNKFQNQRGADTLGRVHTLVYFTLPAIPFVWSNWQAVLVSVNSLRDHLLFTTHHYSFAAHVVACVGMGGLIAMQEGRSLIRGCILDGASNLSLGGIPLYRLLTNLISKTPAKGIARLIDNLWALKKGEIIADLALNIPKLTQDSHNQIVMSSDCVEVLKFKNLECDSSPLSQLYQFFVAQFRSLEVTAEAKRLCAELNKSNLCIPKVIQKSAFRRD